MRPRVAAFAGADTTTAFVAATAPCTACTCKRSKPRPSTEPVLLGLLGQFVEHGLAAQVVPLLVGEQVGDLDATVGADHPVRELVLVEEAYCECRAPCPCAFLKPATEDRCRAFQAYHIDRGKLGDVDLSRRTFAVVITNAPKEMTKGGWEGLIYLPQAATLAQQGALLHLARTVMVPMRWPAYVAPLEWKTDGDKRIFTAKGIAEVRSAPLSVGGRPYKKVNPLFGLMSVYHEGFAESHA